MSHAIRRVLIIDDSPEDREFMRLLLADSGRPFRVDEAETGTAGLRACRDNAEGLPDCILLDYNLPDYDAAELLVMLGGPNLPCCLVVTESSGADYNPVILRLGAQDFIGKGWMDTVSLTRCVVNAIERFGMMNSLREIETLRRSEERVRQYAEELESLMDSAPIAIFISSDPDCRFITGSRMANQRLSATEARSRWLFECDMIGIGYWRIDGAILDANNALLQLLGYEREDIVAGRLNWRRITPPESIVADEAALKEMAERGLIDHALRVSSMYIMLIQRFYHHHAFPTVHT